MKLDGKERKKERKKENPDRMQEFGLFVQNQNCLGKCDKKKNIDQKAKVDNLLFLSFLLSLFLSLSLFYGLLVFILSSNCFYVCQSPNTCLFLLSFFLSFFLCVFLSFILYLLYLQISLFPLSETVN